MLSRFVRTSFQKHPVLSNAVSYTGLYLIAEVSQQIVTKKVLERFMIGYHLLFLSYLRLKFVSWRNWKHCRDVHESGNGQKRPPEEILYRWLDKTYAGTAAKIVTKKVLMDQFLMTPLLLVAFYTTMSALEQREDRGLLDELKDKFVPTFQTSCVFWLPVQTVNFIWIPPVGRVVYVGVASLAWANILCWIKRQPSHKEQATTMA